MPPLKMLKWFFIWFAWALIADSASAQTAANSAAARGYQLHISSLQWTADQANSTGLTVDFTLQRADGTPVKFANPVGAVNVCAWTPNGFECNADHESDAVFQGSSNWQVLVPGLDPRVKIAHFEFDVRDPSTTRYQQADLTSDIEFDNIPLPTQMDAAEAVNDTFTSDWGTKITLTGMTLKSGTDRHQGEVRYDFSVENPKAPDDVAQIQFQNAWDNGVKLDNLYGEWSGRQDNMNAPYAGSSPLAVGSHKTLNVEFQVQEHSESFVRSIVWTPINMDVPLAGIAPPSPKFSADDHSQAAYQGVRFRMEHLNDPNESWNHQYDIRAQSPDASTVVKISKASWTAPPNAQNNPWQYQAQLTKGLYWHVDGTPALAGEVETLLQSQNQQQPSFPLNVTFQTVSQLQQLYTFHAIPAPAAGQQLVLNRKSDNLPLSSLVLKSIAWNAPSNTSPSINDVQHDDTRYALKLVFGFTGPGAATLDLTPIAARDDDNDALNQFDDSDVSNRYSYGVSGGYRLTSVDATDDPLSVYPNQKIFVVQLRVPPHGSKTINLKLLLTRSMPVAPDVQASIDVDGKWTFSTPAAAPAAKAGVGP